MNLVILFWVGLNIVTFALVVYVLFVVKAKGKDKGQNLDQSQLSRIGQSLGQIENLEGEYQKLLQELVSKNKEMIQNTSNNLVKYYQDTVTTLTLNYNQNSEKLMQLLDFELKKRVEKLDQVASTELEEARKEVTAQVKKDLEELNKELDKYSKERFKQVDEKIYQIVSETAKNSVGKVVNLVDHQELVMTALEAAKKDKFFS